MKNNDNNLNQGISWNEFEVVAEKLNNVVRLNPCAPCYKDFRAGVSLLDAGQILLYPYREDDVTSRTDEFRVKRNNEKFGFSVDNPSDLYATKAVRI